MHHDQLTASCVTVNLLTYQKIDDTVACLDSIYKLAVLPGTIMVCDNGSSPETVTALHEQWCAVARRHKCPEPVRVDVPLTEAPQPSMPQPSMPQTGVPPTNGGHTPSGVHRAGSHQAVLLSLPVNLGFSGGHNAMLRYMWDDPSCSAFWILNNDTVADPQALETLICATIADPAVGAVGSTLLNPDDSDTLQCAGGGSLQPLTGTTQLLGAGVARKCAHKLQTTVDKRLAFVGASLFVRREVLERVGFFDPNYFLYYEDVDWCTRATQLGYRIAWARGSYLIHKEGGSSGAKSAHSTQQPSRPVFIDYLCIRNRFYFLRRHYPWCLPTAVLSLAVVCLNRLRRKQGGRIPLLLRAAVQGVRQDMRVQSASQFTTLFPDF